MRTPRIICLWHSHQFVGWHYVAQAYGTIKTDSSKDI